MNKDKTDNYRINNKLLFIIITILFVCLPWVRIHSEWWGFGFSYPPLTYGGVIRPPFTGLPGLCIGADYANGGDAGFSFENPTNGSIMPIYNCAWCDTALVECTLIRVFKFIDTTIILPFPPQPQDDDGGVDGGSNGGGDNNQYCGKEGNPINPAYGTKYEKYTDVSFKNTGFNLEFKRIYNTNLQHWPVSFTAATGNMGTYWRNNYDYSVIKRCEMQFLSLSSGVKGWVGGSDSGFTYKYYADVIFPDGGRYVFEGGGENGPYYFEGRSAWKLENISGGMKLEMGSRIYLFNELGTLMAITNKQGKGVFLTYNAESTEVTDNSGRKLIINKDEDGLISSVDSNISGFIPFVYEHLEYYEYYKLASVKRNNVIYSRYQYDSNGLNYALMDRQVDFKKEGIYRDQSYSFITDNGRIKYSEEYATWDSTKKILKLTYNPDGVTVEDKKGIHTNYYDTLGRIITKVFPDSYESWVYDIGGKITNRTQRNGTTEQYFYDSNGYIYKITTTWQEPSANRTKDEFYNYDSNGNLTSYTDGEGNVTTYQYDEEGRITHVIRGGRDVSYSYYATGLVKTIHDGENMSKTHTYDACGNVTLIRNNATGGEEVYSYYNNGIDGRIESYTGEDLIEKEYIYDADFPLKIKTTVVKENSVIKDTISYYYTPYGDNSQAGNLESVSDNMGTVSYEYNDSHLLISETDRADGLKEYDYDGWGRITTIEDSSGMLKNYLYDANGNVERIIDSSGFTRFEYDKAGNRTKVVDRNGKATQYSYDGMSRLRKVTDAKGGETEYDYDKNGNRTLIVDAEENDTDYEYDEYDRMVKETFADGSYVSYTYSISGDLKKREVIRSGSSTKTQDFTYDNGHRMTSDDIYSYTFSCTCGKLGSVSGPDGTVSYEYDYKGRVKKTTYPDNTTVENIFLESSKQKIVIMDNVTLFVINLDEEGRAEGTSAVVEQVGGASNAFGITRDEMGRVEGMTYPNEDSSTTEYDMEGRIKKHRNYYKNKLINKFEETLDAEGNKLKEKTNVGTRNYGYDSIYQLTSASYERSQSYTWAYDSAGNRTYAVEPLLAAAQSYTPNNLNQYSSVNSVSYSYDSDGNLLSDGVRSFSWDEKNRLTTVIDGSLTWTYKYNHNDLRVEKTVVGGATTKYFYDGSILLAEKVGSQIQKIYINDGTGIIGMVRPIYDGSNNLTHYQRLYYLYDSLGSVSAITGEHGLPLQNYTYSPYGTCLNVTGDPINNLQFVGRYGGYKDNDTGLTYFWHRWYDSKDGRWISRDPIGVNGGINVYAYTLNSPTNWLDISGLAIGDFPPAPPGYNPNTWTSGQWDNGKLWVKSPDGRTYTIHTEDSGHWRHWDIDDDSKWPPDSGKKRSNQDKTKKGQCEIDPSGDTPPWNPPSLFSEYSFFFYPMFGPIPFTFTAPCFGFCTPVFAW